MDTEYIIKCPLCKTENYYSDITFRDDLKHVCCLCLKNIVKVHLHKCKHLCICSYCFYTLDKIKISTV
jgi:hypothetical protein